VLNNAESFVLTNNTNVNTVVMSVTTF
jgi:hypothetical protein